jgi:putative membrane protein
MLAAALIAFGHFLAFFALIAAVVLQLALVSESMSVETARRIQRADRFAGISAVLLLVFGFLRVFEFEKGSAYYFSNSFFVVKLTLFFIAASISLYPTISYLRWNRDLARGAAPAIGSAPLKRIKSAIHWQLVLILGILLCASLMAKGFGS